MSPGQIVPKFFVETISTRGDVICSPATGAVVSRLINCPLKSETGTRLEEGYLGLSKKGKSKTWGW